jgi:alginate O-acetyltransferase complex protein AlgI
MVFSSVIFLFGFLPTVIVTYYAPQLFTQRKLGNIILLVFSYLFYLYGSADFLLILLLSTLADYALGLMIERDIRRTRLWLSLSVLINCGLLVYFKYTNFFVGELNGVLARLGFSPLPLNEVLLP